MTRNNSLLCIIGTIVLFELLTTIVVVVGQTVPCYMCANDPAATISNPNVLINLTGLPGIPPGITTVPCLTIFDALKGGIAVNRTTCDTLLTTPEVVPLLQEPCGCSKISVFTSAPAVAGAPTNVPVAIPVVSKAPTNAPIPIPVPVVTNAPVTNAPVTTAPVTAAPVVKLPTIAPTAAKIVTTAPVVVVVPVPVPIVPPSVRAPTAASLRKPVENDSRSNDSPQHRPTSRNHDNDNDNNDNNDNKNRNNNDHQNDNNKSDNNDTPQHKPKPKPKPKPVPVPVKRTNRPSRSEKKPVKAVTTSPPTISMFPTRTAFPSSADAARSAESGSSNIDNLDVNSIAQLSVSLDYSNLYEREYDIGSTNTGTKSKNDVIKN